MRRFTRETIEESATANAFELGGVAALEEVVRVIETGMSNG